MIVDLIAENEVYCGTFGGGFGTGGVLLGGEYFGEYTLDEDGDS